MWETRYICGEPPSFTRYIYRYILKSTMTELFPEPFLPKVTKADLDSLLYEHITDPAHRKRWLHLVSSNPTLAYDIMQQAYDRIHDTTGDIAHVKVVIDAVTYAVSALEAAVKRQQASGGAVDDASPQPLT